jgi:ankyrin repeat protein
MLPLTQILIHSSFISFYLFFYHYYYFFPSSIFSVNEIIIIIKIGQKLGYDIVHEGKLLFLVLLVSETARKLLEKEKKLTETTDENGWSPLQYAACYDWSPRIVQVLLENDASAAYIAETEKRRTALHIAAIQGHVNAMKEIVSRCPACCELVDNRGWNALHYVENIPLLARLETKKDDKGNMPFHLNVALAHEQKQWRPVLDEYSEGEIYGLNKRKLSVNDIYEGNFAEIQVINPHELTGFPNEEI